jgi:hypothetical protein
MDLALHRAVAFPSLVYRPRRPEQEVLHSIVRDHYETFRAQASERREGQGLPQFVERAFEDLVDMPAVLGWLRQQQSVVRVPRRTETGDAPG